MHTKLQSENVKEEDHVRDLDSDEEPAVFEAKDLLKKFPAIVKAESSLPSLEEPLTHLIPIMCQINWVLKIMLCLNQC